MQWPHNSFQTGTLTQGKWPDRPLDEGDVCGAGEGCECSWLRGLMQGQEEARWGCSMQGQWGGAGARSGEGDESGQHSGWPREGAQKCPRSRRSREQSYPSLAVNPVFDPAEDSKEASTNGARPSVSGTHQSAPHSEARGALIPWGSWWWAIREPGHTGGKCRRPLGTG